MAKRYHDILKRIQAVAESANTKMVRENFSLF